ncbi:MAG: hypothetical protein AAFN12_02015 [Cyanobacteria bacterium J06560_2]
MSSGRRFTKVEVLEIAEKLLAILSYPHQQTTPVIHRDIKPSNILMSTQADGIGELYLVDFGSVQTGLSKETGTITIVGSYGYIPLEQFAGQATEASDLYGLGMTLIHLITGVHPADCVYIDGKIQLGANSIEPALAKWLKRMTHPYLNQRFESAEVALRALRAKEDFPSSYRSLKPAGSQVDLVQTGDRIRIITNKHRRKRPKLINFATPIFFTLMLYQISVTGHASILFWLLFLSSALYLPAAIIQLIIYLSSELPLEKRRAIELDRTHGIREGTCSISDSQKIYWDGYSGAVANIDLVAYNPGYSFTGKFKKDANTNAVGTGIVPPKLSIHIRSQAYTIGSNQLSPAELWWLGQALSDFLGLELQTIYPMPAVSLHNICA